jgi:hypothetical protein
MATPDRMSHADKGSGTVADAASFPARPTSWPETVSPADVPNPKAAESTAMPELRADPEMTKVASERTNGLCTDPAIEPFASVYVPVLELARPMMVSVALGVPSIVN